VQVDIRIIAATHRDLAGEVRSGRFRADLYFRLNVLSLVLPPLRARRSDVPALAMHFLRRHAQENGSPATGIDDEALAVLAGYDWPGNIRELDNVIARAVVVARGERIRPTDLPELLRPEVESGAPPIPGSTLADVERHLILKTLEHTGGNKERAAGILGISHRKIQYKLREYATADGQPAPRDRSGSQPGRVFQLRA
jgi:DNA-binding NtrC family response regulator